MAPSLPARLPFSVLLVAAVSLSCGGGQAPPATAVAPSRAVQPVTPLLTTPIAGQSVPVLPITILVSDDTVGNRLPVPDHGRALLWADSVVGAALVERRPEVKWVLPPEVRRVARRSPGVAPDPDHMGQGLLREHKIDQVPDPLRSAIRGLVALSGGRFAMVPAALSFTTETAGGVRAELSMVMVDARAGRVVWRTVATGFGATPQRALVSALEVLLPLNLG